MPSMRKKTYTFKVKGIYDKSQSIAVFMPIDKFADIFDLKDDQFSGFLSDTKIKDIDENNIATTITIHDITKMADQLDHSMGAYMSYFQVLCILLAAVMIYLLTKLIIEKNETAISMTKILGYENKEIASLYLVSTSIVVVLADLISVVIGDTSDEGCMENDAVLIQRLVCIQGKTAGLCKNVCICADRISDSNGIRLQEDQEDPDGSGT